MEIAKLIKRQEEMNNQLSFLNDKLRKINSMLGLSGNHEYPVKGKDNGEVSDGLLPQLSEKLDNTLYHICILDNEILMLEHIVSNT